MDINNIQGRPFQDASFPTEGPGKTNANPEVSNANQSTVGKEKPTGDRITLSNTDIKTEQAFALNVLDKLNTSAPDKLNSIRAKIADGFYNSDEAVSKISNLITRDLSAIDSANTSGISEDQKDFLLNDPEVLQTVSSRISDELKNL